MRRVSARVSMPEMPILPLLAIHAGNSPWARKLEGGHVFAHHAAHRAIDLRFQILVIHADIADVGKVKVTICPA
jgi:hypothetical protein